MTIAKKFVRELGLIADGSVLVVGNPDQITYSLNVYEED